MRTKIIFLIIFLIFAGTQLSFAIEKTVYKIGAFNYFPGIFKDSDNSIKGYFVESLTEIEKEQNIKFEYIYGTWSECLERLKLGEIDILPAVGYSPERSTYLDYGVEDILTVWSELYVLNGSRIDGITSIDNKKIGVMRNDINKQMFIDLIEKFGISCKIENFSGFEDICIAIQNKSIDAGVINSAFGIAKQNFYSIKSTGIVFNPFKIYFATKKYQNKNLLNLIDSYLMKWKKNSNSIFLSSRQKWSHIELQREEAFPKWLTITIISVTLTFLISLLFNLLLKKRINLATEVILKRETEIREREEKLSTTLDSIGDGVIATDNAGFITNMNPVAEKLCGYNYKEAKGKLLTEVFSIINANTRESVVNPVEMVIRNGKVIGLANHTVLISKSGIEYQIADSAAPIKDKNGIIIGVVLVFSDVSEDYALQKALRESEEKYRTFFLSIIDGICLHEMIFDDNGTPIDYRIIDSNSKLEELTGFKRSEIIGKPATELYNMNPPPFLDIYSKVAIEKTKTSFETYYEPFDKHYIISAFPTEENKFATVFQDISEKILAIEKLKNSEEFNRKIVETASEGIWAIDNNSNTLYLNKTMANMLGYEPEEMIDSNLKYFLYEEDIEDHNFRIKQRINRIDGFYERKFRHKSGYEVWTFVSATPNIDKNGKVIGSLGMFTDITQRKKAEDKLKNERLFTNALIDSLPGIFYLYSYPMLKLISWNKNIETVFGYTTEEIGNSHISKLHPKENHDLIIKNADYIMEVGSNTLESTLLTKKGKEILYLMTGIKFEEQGEKYLMGFGINTSEKKLTEDALRKSEELLQEMGKIAKIGAWEFDTSTFQGNWTKEVAHIHELVESSSVSVADAVKFYTPESKANIEAAIQDSISYGKPYKLELEMITKNNNHKWVRTIGQPILKNEKVTKLRGSFQDITEEKILKNTQLFLIKSSFQKTNQDFFVELAKYLADTLFMEYISIIKLSGDNQSAETLAVYFDGKYEDNFKFNLKENPYHDIYNDTICCYSSGIRQLFPNNTILQNIPAESYIGTTLWSSHGEPLGLISVIGRNNITNIELYETIIRLVAIRSAGELERRIAEDIIIESNKTFSDIVHSIPTGLYIYQFVEPDKLYFLMGNVSAERLNGIKNSDLIGKEFNDIWSNARKFGITEKCLDVVYKNENLNIEELYYSDDNIDGTFRVYSFLIPGNRLVVSFDNITKMKLVENEIKESENKFRSYIENAPDGIFILNSKGKCLELNKATTFLFGYSKEELLELPSYHLISKNFQEHTINIFKNLQVNDYYSDEIEFVRKDSSEFIGLLSVVKISDDKDIIFIKNIDDIKKTEIELLKAKDKAEESDRLKSAFLANMSHEIRTPMNGIIGYSQILTDPDLEENERIEFANILNNSCYRLLNTVNDVLEISKIDAGLMNIKETEFTLYKLFLELFEIHIKGYKNKGLELKYVIPVNNRDLTIFSDEQKIYQIFNNLLNNAFKFTNSGIVEYGYLLNDNIIEFFVTDTGIGISEIALESIFERFHQEDTSVSRGYDGTGLGLSIAKGLVELLNGKISVESEKGVGTKFTFSIPYKRNIANIATEEEIIEETINKEYSQYTILVVEDEISNYILIDRILNRELKCNILKAVNGLEAIECFKENPSVSLIIMDIKMPIMDGISATLEIRKLNKHVPIIAVTAFALSGDKEKALDAGCNDYISKPFDKDDLINKIKMLLSD